ncbi:hypothetical protein TWF102_005787 [Orbilia oligospora]|uniref:Uncharacterized protein n=1 Tax=Orbilia oligospora TaxID=2813651 RepID=A0A7C8JSI2_ORBOL|nr:hypothetical protein TWF102_005787 [Orbilia oligospora]
MYLPTSTSAVIAFLSCASSIYGHALIADAYGNANDKVRSRGLGTTSWYNKGPYGTDLHPWQTEVSIFASSAIPCCHKPRKYQPQGCGLNLGLVWRKEIKPSAWLMLHGWHSPTIQNVFQAQRGYSLDVKEEVNKFVGTKMVAQVTAGGWLRMRVHQVNADGAGPFMCKLDHTGIGNAFGPLQNLKENIHGDKHSINLGTIHKGNLWITFVLPTDLRCTGTYGNMKNICLVRCENKAANGPFGSCVPVQQIVTNVPKPKPVPKPVVTPKPVVPVPVRPPTKEELSVALGGEVLPKTVTVYLKEQQKIPTEEKEVLAEAEKANEEAAKDDENVAMLDYY